MFQRAIVYGFAHPRYCDASLMLPFNFQDRWQTPLPSIEESTRTKTDVSATFYTWLSAHHYTSYGTNYYNMWILIPRLIYIYMRQLENKYNSRWAENYMKKVDVGTYSALQAWMFNFSQSWICFGQLLNHYWKLKFRTHKLYLLFKKNSFFILFFLVSQ